MTDELITNGKPLDIVAAKIAKGSDAELARILGVSRATVSCWRSADRRPAGMVGTIPQRYHAAIIELSRQAGANVTAEDLLGSGSRAG